MAAAMEVDPAPLSDEEWLIWRAKSCIKSDLYSSKAWLITAKTLFPQNFNIQYEAYSIEINNKNIPGAAKLLEQMFKTFSTEPQLWVEVKKLLTALQSEHLDPATKMQKEIFSMLPTQIQCLMLSHTAEATSDILEKCRLMTIVLQRYPNGVPEQGVKMIDSLLAAEKQTHFVTAVNCYRKYMVYDVLPVVLNAPPAELPQKQALRWLQKGIEFYISYITCPPFADTIPTSTSAELMSPTKKIGITFGGQGYKKVQIPGLPDRESYILKPWEKLFKLFRQIAVVLDWKVDQIFCSSSREPQWLQIYAMFQTRSQPQGDSMVPHKQILYCTTLLFLDCLYNYASAIDAEQFAGTASGSHSAKQLVLIESFDIKQEHKLKKGKTDSSLLTIQHSKAIGNSKEISQNFLTALKCWDLLHSAEPLEKDFKKMCQHWKADNWLWLKCFEADIHIYQGEYQEAVSILQNLMTVTTNLSKVKTELQLASCYYFLGKYLKACECILNVATSLPLCSESGEFAAHNANERRQLHLICCTTPEILPFCIQLLLTCLWEKYKKNSSDVPLGHMIVLMQYNWPHHEGLFRQVISQIKQAGNFTYHLFFAYVINVDVLEEFAFLESVEGGNVSLDILSSSAKNATQQRTITRGVNKNVKEDFKLALEKQVARNHENIELLIRQFISQGKSAILKTLS